MLIAALLVLVMFASCITECFAAEMKVCGDPNTPKPEVSAESALLYSIDLDENIYEKNINDRHDPYSVTKLMTAYLAAQKLDMNSTVTISKAAADDDPEGSSMNLVEGEVVTVENLMYGALLLSGNDAAYALGELTSGSMDSFVKLMNDTAKEWGCEDTHFVNPSGWKNSDHYTTANDLLIIARHALADETVRRIAFTRKYTMPATNKYKERVMKNHVTLTKQSDSGVLGGKTGFWEEDDASVVVEYNKYQLSAILVLLKDGSKARTKDAQALFEYAHKATPGFVVDRKGSQVGHAWIRCAARTRAATTLDKTVHAYPKKQKKSGVKTKIKYRSGLKAPLKKGTTIGTYTVYVDGKKVASEKVLLAEDAEKGWFPSAIYISNFTTVCIIVVILLLVLLRMILRRYIMRKRRAGKKRRNMLE